MKQRAIRGNWKWLLQALCTLAFALGLSHGAAWGKKAPLKGVININTASAEQLKLLPRVGPKMAQRIIAYRSKKKFARPRDIMKVRGIGKKTFAKMKPNLTTTGPTNVRPAGSPPAKR